MKKMLPPEKVPMQTDAWSSQGVRFPNNNSTWEHSDCCKTLHTKAMIFADEFAKDELPHGNENNRNRDEHLLRSGSVLCSSIKHINCQSRIESNKNLLMIKMNVEPSMKKKLSTLL